MKKLIALLLFSCLTAATVRADVIWQELFNYADGPIIVNSTNSVPPTNALWTRFSGTASPSDLLVKNKRLEVWTTVSGGLPRQDDCGRLFATTAGSIYTNAHQPIYVSFIVNFTNLPSANGAYCAMFKFGAASSSSFEGKFWALTGNPAQPTNNFTTLPNTFRLGVSAAGTASSVIPSAVYGVDLALKTDYQVVLFWDPVTDDALSLWVNPVSSSNTKVESGAGGDTFTPSASNIADDFAFRQATGFGGFFTVSNLVIATTFSEAATNCLFTNAVAPKIVYQPIVGVSNFVDSTFSLSAVVNGQGLGNMVYQWQISSSPADTSPQNVQDVSPDATGYNANVLNLTDAQTIDTGYYTLVATTPYGLSVTSSVSKVVISATPVPPTFITQPVSQTAYKGQTVTFSTSVSSPGNIFFTWYSNNVVVTDGQVDNGSSSTLTLPNVATNFSATYKVTVTNDVLTTTGVVSTNAVLTVSNAPIVSIAYLRSLIDPTTFVPTSPLTQPFQVTGIITSYTNLTSGNTANYYLQDATAGIDMFVTFGSTFRPQLGDQVTFDGVLSSFNNATGGLELYADTTHYPYTSYTIVSSGNARPAARVIPFTVTNDYGYLYVNTNLMGSLVSLTNVYFGTNAGTVTLTNNQAITVTNAGGLPFTLEFYGLDQDTTNRTLPTFASSVTGNLVGFTPSVVLAITKFSDIVSNTPASPTIIPTISAGVTGISLVNGNVVINGTNGQTTGVYYLLESANIATPLSLWIPVATNVVTTSGANGAFTFTGTNAVTPGGQQQFYILSSTNSNHP